MKLLNGRSFSKEFSDDESKIVINEKAANLLDFSNPVGTEIKFGEEKRQIIGVVKDFHLGALYEEVEPLFFRYSPGGKEILVKIQAGQELATIRRIEEFYERFFPGKLFEFSFLDDDYQSLYDAEQRVAVLCRYFSILAILISCLGLFGLATFSLERRNKEIGIRKALGQSSTQIPGLERYKPARHLVRKRHKYFIGELDPCASVEFTRGCPWDCVFCSAWTFYGRSYRKLSPQEAADDLESIKEPNVFIVDDVAFIRPEHGMAIADEIERRGIQKQYYLETRADVLLRNPEVFERWAKLGLRYMFLGIEAIDEEGLKAHRKRVNMG
ncbi:MAG: radical SAM protein, partial [Bacteroidota bacterium]